MDTLPLILEILKFENEKDKATGGSLEEDKQEAGQKESCVDLMGARSSDGGFLLAVGGGHEIDRGPNSPTLRCTDA